MIIVIQKIPDLGIVNDIANVLEWVNLIVLPHFSFIKALLDLIKKHQSSSGCSKIDEVIDLATFCDNIRNNNRTHLCCPGELQNVISLTALRYCRHAA